MRFKTHWTDLLWGYLAQGMNIGAGVLILPLLLKKLSTEEVGIWFVLLTVYSLVPLLEAGISPTISRNITYILSGAKSLREVGISTNDASSSSGSIDWLLLQRLLEATRKIYWGLGLVIFTALLTLGSVYFVSIARPLPYHLALALWLIHVLACGLNMGFAYSNALLIGFGQMSSTYRSVVYSRGGFLLLGWLALSAGLGLTGIVVANFVMVLLYRLLAMHYSKKALGRLSPHLDGKSADFSKFFETFRILWPNMLRSGLVAAGAFLITRSNTLISSKSLGLLETAKYGLSLQLFAVLMSISQVAFTNSFPAMSSARLSGNLCLLRQKVRTATFISLGTYAAGTLVIVLLGQIVLSSIGSKTGLMGPSQLLLMSLIFLLELNHSNFAGVITTRNEIPFVKAALASGIAIVSSSLLLLQFTNWGIWALLASQGLVQLAYNNWKWPLDVLREFKEIKTPA